MDASVEYFSRRLMLEANGNPQQIGEADLLTMSGAIVVLGEPGMGKSRLLEELARQTNTRHVTASRFLRAKNARQFASATAPLLIDAVDEVTTSRDGGAVEKIFERLEEVDTPSVVLACRAREWQSRATRDLGELYAHPPTVCTLLPFDRDEATRFLHLYHPKADRNAVLAHLDARGLTALWGNPLTLKLIGGIAETGKPLPDSRADLFDEICHQILPEHDGDRQPKDLLDLGADAAADVAGAVAAALLLAGAEAVGISGAAQLREGDLHIADLDPLINIHRARTVVTSTKLFIRIDQDRVAPVHRVIAEFLGARWLAGQVETPRTRRRLLAKLQGADGVPASLRGLHAWLAWHGDADTARTVIQSDVVGVLKYGQIKEAQIREVLQALESKSKENPLFRIDEWSLEWAKSLISRGIHTDILRILSDRKANSGLREILLHAISKKYVSDDILGILKEILLSSEFSYSERVAAAGALIRGHDDQAWLYKTITGLTELGESDGARLAYALVDMLGYNVPPRIFVTTILHNLENFADVDHMEEIYCEKFSNIIRENCTEILNLLEKECRVTECDSIDQRNVVSEIMAILLLRVVTEDILDDIRGSDIWRWLKAIRAGGIRQETANKLMYRFDERSDLRQMVRRYVVQNRHDDTSLYELEAELYFHFVGLSGRPTDIIEAFDKLAEQELDKPYVQDDWRDLVQIVWNTDWANPMVRAAADRAMRHDQQLAAWLDKYRYAKDAGSEPQQSEQNHIMDRTYNNKEERQIYRDNRDKIREGDPKWTYRPALKFLSHGDALEYKDPNLKIIDWIGEDILSDILLGFEATLHLNIPDINYHVNIIISGNFYAPNLPFLAGIFRRVDNENDMSDISIERKYLALLLCYENRGRWMLPVYAERIQIYLEKLLLLSVEDQVNFARQWIEPFIVAGIPHIAGLERLCHNPDWQAAGVQLAKEWFSRFPSLPYETEEYLIDSLIIGGEMAILAKYAVQRIERENVDNKSRLLWISAIIIADSEKYSLVIRKYVGKNDDDLLFVIRDRIQSNRSGRWPELGIDFLSWLVAAFRDEWPVRANSKSGWGCDNHYEATLFIIAVLDRLANDTSSAAASALQSLADAPRDTYTDIILHKLTGQRRRRGEEGFSVIQPINLAALLCDGKPVSMADLVSLVLEELDQAQRRLKGDAFDPVRNFWILGNEPREAVPLQENRCRDQLALMLQPELRRYDVLLMPEVDMPADKRADLGFTFGAAMQLPCEVKGQWNPDVWDAASGQLAEQYMIDWKSDGWGIYCVLWFGDLPSSTKRRLKPPPDDLPCPESAEKMRRMLIERIPEDRRSRIKVVVLDLSAGHPST
ncbi:NACHT domain-containing NTPase [Tistrella mobilis]|uniref:NACHT domain-containing protein n=1 Tax=Tistrella mobilis TaxID=171437 RepID=UPI0035560859